MSWLAPLAVSWGLAILLAPFDGRRRWVSGVASLVLLAVLALDLYLLVQLRDGARELVTGNWPVGVGIRLRVDALSLLFASASTAVLAAALAHSLFERLPSRVFPALVAFMCAGLHGMFFTHDAFNFYVFFELAIAASFGLAGHGHGRAGLRATFVYLVLNLFGSVLFLAAIAALYQVTGSLDFSQIQARAGDRRVLLIGSLLVTAFSLKLGLFPFHQWVPVVYRDTRPVVAAALAGALANVGSYGLLRFGYAALPLQLEAGREALMWLGALSALYGSTLALNRAVPGEIVAYGAVAHAGLLFIAIGLGEGPAVAAALWLVLAGAIDKACLFLALDLPDRGGKVAAVIGAMGVAGIPISAGFIGKMLLLRAALDSDPRFGPWIAATIVLVSLLSVAGLFRAIGQIPGGEMRGAQDRSAASSWPAIALACTSLALAGLAGPVHTIVEVARSALGAVP